MKKIYIAGSGGMLGEAFYEVFKNSFDLFCSDIDLNAEWLHFLDFRDYNSYRLDVVNFNPDYLFHLGAHTDLEYCESNIDDSYLTNTISVENAVSIANELNIPLLYISTAGIFDGEMEFYDDWDTPNPLGVYARSKYMAERFVIENCRKYYICRAGWMMGGGPKKDKKFIGKLIKQITGGAKKLYIVNDKDGTPTFTQDFAKTVMALTGTEFYGLYNLVCSGNTSRVEVAKHLLEVLNISDIEIVEVDSSHFQTEYFAQRPPSENLLNRKLDLRGLNLMTDWKTALENYINIYYAHLKHEK
jgi:dTDP-4-dehydrorhamnose reductase